MPLIFAPLSSTSTMSTFPMPQAQWNPDAPFISVAFKSMFLDLNMTSTKENLSPIIDLDKKSIVAFSNRLNNIDSSSDVFPTTSFVGPTEPEGDSNEAIYCTCSHAHQYSKDRILQNF